MSDGEALRRAVFDAPWDDALRLVYADWLQEHGDEAERAQGEFIRVQTRLEQGRTRELLDEYGRLMAAHEARWMRHLPDGLRQRRTVDFRGGFVRGVTLSVAQALAHGPDVVRHYPIDSLGLTTLPALKDAKELVASPLRWDRLRSLGVHGQPRSAAGALKLLCDAPLANLIQLHIINGVFAAKTVRMLTEWPGLAKLHSLSFLNTRFDYRAAALLFGLPGLAAVAELSFYAAGLGDDAAQALLRSPFAGGAGTLSLNYNHFTEPLKAQLRERFGARLNLG